MHIRISLCVLPILFICLNVCQARVNILEPLSRGQDSKIGKPLSYQTQISFKTVENLVEIPFQLDFTAGSQMEIGGCWSLKNISGKTGIGDLIIGTKYQFIDGNAEKPAVFGEAAISLPTADYKNGFGTGAMGVLLNWGMEKDFDDLTGYFGLGIVANAENPDKIRKGGVFIYRIGAEKQYDRKTAFSLEMKGFNHSDTKINGSMIACEGYQELYVVPGIKYSLKNKKIISGSFLLGITPHASKIGLLMCYQ